MSNNGSGQTTDKTSNGGGDDAMASFANLGGDALDTETLDLFGSFTNEAGANSGLDGLGDLGGLGASSFGQFSANDLSGFGVDLNTFDLGNSVSDGAGAMDLSSIQLMNLDDSSLPTAGGNGANQLTASTDDAAQMMARLLGPGAQMSAPTGASPSLITTEAASIARTSGANPLLAFADTNNTSYGMPAPTMQSIEQAAGATTMGDGGLAASQAGPQQPQVSSAKPRKPSSGSRNHKSRSNSLSSDDMGDIPLAQLTLMQSGQQASGGMPSQTTGAAAFTTIPIQEMGISGQLPLSSQLTSQVAAPGQQTMAAISAASLGMNMAGDVGVPGGRVSSVLGAPGGAGDLFGSAVQGRGNVGSLAQGLQQLPMSQMHPQTMLQQLGQVGDLQSQIHGSGMAGAVGMTSAQAALAGPSFGASGATNTPAPESEIRGVESTVHTTKQRGSDQSVNSKLKLELFRPATSTDETPLDQLEEIEDQLCGLLDTASKVTRIMTGPSGSEQLGLGMDVGNTKIKSMVKEFMQSVVRIQAALQFQHKKLVDRGIPIQTSVGFQSDVAGFERDLVCWSDAARLLSSALDSAIEYSSISG